MSRTLWKKGLVTKGHFAVQVVGEKNPAFLL